ncbi:MAG: hypothetical protein LDL42_08365 [Rhizobium sp.]|nr:hypothetical protein [Rhizobium sp.]
MIYLLSDVPILMLFPDRVIMRRSSLEHRIAIFVPLHARRGLADFGGSNGAGARPSGKTLAKPRAPWFDRRLSDIARTSPQKPGSRSCPRRNLHRIS